VARVIIVAFEGVQTLDVTGPAEVFAVAARVASRPLYQVEVASVGGGTRTTSAGMTIGTRDLRRVRPRVDDIVVVAGGGDVSIRAAMADGALLRWLIRAHAAVAVTASVCSGAFVLAAAGLLDGKRAATHWSACEILGRAFPRVRVDKNAIFVHDGSIWTSAGVTTGIDMALALVEKDHGRALADSVAARLVLYVRRPGFQSQFSSTLVAQTTPDDGLSSAVAWARSHLGEADVESLAKKAGMSLRTLHRRCLEALGTTPARLVDKLRVEHARALLQARPMAFKELAIECGFGSVARLNRAFGRELGMTPRDYRALHAA
jgi:transcriptional regulator GlxA family with amidase domain